MKQPPKIVRWSLLAAILFLAAGLRLTRLGMIEFKFDEAATARSALGIAREGQLPAIGMISSRGPHNPALMSYVLAPALAIARDPRIAAAWVALLGVAAVGVTYWMGNSYLGWPVGALAAALFAASPWAVFLSRKTWAENLPVLTLGFVAALLAVAVRRKPWALAGVLAAASGLVSLHLGGLAFFFISAAVLALFVRRVQLKPLAVGIALVALVLSPYFLYDARHDWQNARAFLRMSDAEAVLDLEALRMAAVVTGGYRLESLAGARQAEFVAGLPSLRWLDLAQIALLVGGLVWSTARVIRARVRSEELPPGEAARLILVCWFVVPVVLLTARSAPIQPHSLSVLFPVQHLIVALVLVDGVTAVKRRLGPRWARVTGAGAAAFAVALLSWQVYFQQSLLDFVDTHDTPGGYGAPVKYAIEVTRRAADLRQEGDGPIVALLPGGDPRFDGQASVFDVLLPADSRLVDGRQALVLPREPTVLLAAPGSEPAIQLLAAVAEEQSRALPARTGSPDRYRFFRWVPSGDLPFASVVTGGARWESGVTLLGYAWEGDPRPGKSIRWTLVFSADGPPPADTDLHWFNHLVDGEARRWGQADSVGYPAPEWRAGDVVAVWFDLTISPDAPAPPYTVRSGMYTYPEVVTISVVDEAGNPAGQFVELGPVGPVTAR